MKKKTEKVKNPNQTIHHHFNRVLCSKAPVCRRAKTLKLPFYIKLNYNYRSVKEVNLQLPLTDTEKWSKVLEKKQ